MKLNVGKGISVEITQNEDVHGKCRKMWRSYKMKPFVNNCSMSQGNSSYTYGVDEMRTLKVWEKPDTLLCI
jgi:hypothetical protein